MMGNCYLLGLPGVGKTYYGVRWAKSLNMDILDIDDQIEKKVGKPITDIFRQEGEARFRIYEREELLSTSYMSNVIISCGGGVSNSYNNIQWMNALGLTVYIKAPINGIAENILKETASRPYFKGMNKAEIALKLSNLEEIRRKNYDKSTLIWEVGNDEEQIKSQIISTLKNMRE